jgi:transcriptional regulator with GAF, ATPase, and Fis domain
MTFLNVVGKLVAATIEKSRIFKNLTDDYMVMKTGMMAERANEYLIGESQAMIEIRETIDKVAQSDSTILITGETGTGKGVVARLIHSKSMRKDQKFVQVNCGGLPDALFESELFGKDLGSNLYILHQQIFQTGRD